MDLLRELMRASIEKSGRKRKLPERARAFLPALSAKRERLSLLRKLCGQGCPRSSLMFEVPDACKDHRDVMFIRGGDDFFVTY